jgi:hypothetical protein
LSSFSDSSTLATEYAEAASASRMSRASTSFLASNFAPFHSFRRAWNLSSAAVAPEGLTVAVIFQYSS